jgi:HAD superfamily hydrolase (TIGR01459 family)
MTQSAKVHPDITEISSSFKGILLDAYGVFWGGNAFGLLAGAALAMKELVSSGKIVGILSNSTQASSVEMEKFDRQGLKLNSHFHFLVTSAEVAKHIFLNEKLPFKTPRKTYYLFGQKHSIYPSSDIVYEGTTYTESPHLEDADFIYVLTPHINGEDQLDPEVFRKEVEKLFPKNLPMVCPNPDRFAHEGNPPRAVVRQGSIAELYEKMGGHVYYIGKPEESSFRMAMKEFKKRQIKDPKDILMVGDTPETDIRGAKRFGMKAALVLQTGIMSDRISHTTLKRALDALPLLDTPDYFLERL